MTREANQVLTSAACPLVQLALLDWGGGGCGGGGGVWVYGPRLFRRLDDHNWSAGRASVGSTTPPGAGLSLVPQKRDLGGCEPG